MNMTEVIATVEPEKSEPYVSEVKAAIHKMKNNKSSGPNFSRISEKRR